MIKNNRPGHVGNALKGWLTLYILVFLYNGLYNSCSAQERFRISADLTCTPLQEDVFLITHFFPKFGSNSLFIALPGSKGVLIDTPLESTGTLALLDWIDSTFGALELIAFNTGWHQDNMGGNAVLRSRDIDVYGPDLTARMVSTRGDELKALLLESTRDLEDRHYFELYRQLVLVPPNKTFPIEEGLKLEFGDEVFEVYFPGESHTVDNTVVYLHKRQILFGGCMVLAAETRRPGFTAHANMSQWPLSIKNVIEKFPPARTVVPGHGQPGGVSLLYHTVEVLERFNAENHE